MHKAILVETWNNKTGKYDQETQVVPMTEEEIEEHNALCAMGPSFEDTQRLHRQFLLSDTDFLASLSDRPLSDAMREYRQALRDITTHPNWPNLEESDWPVKPEE